MILLLLCNFAFTWAAPSGNAVGFGLKAVIRQVTDNIHTQ
jgi:hypothetical protein